MRVLSLFSGVGGFDIAVERAGMEVVGQCEIDPFCRKVLAHHWPDVARWDDVRAVSRESFGLADEGGERCGTTKRRKPLVPVRRGDGDATERGAHGQQQPDLRQPDLIVGGFPCQDVSVAGRRAGLDGARSGLWFEFQRILRELRPRWAVIENVPGLLSSNSGRDFGTILDGLGECGFGGIAWAVLDSQHFGVAQRRRRVFVVCGPTRRGAEQVLALCESCGGHPQTGRTAGEDVAYSLGASTYDGSWKGADRETYVPEIVGALDTANGHHGYATTVQQAMAGHFLAVRTAQTSANGHGVAEDMAHTIDGANGQAVAYTLRADGFDASEDGTGRGTPLTAVGATVRRLTPTECMRLQGFPDDWFEGNDKSDGPIYRAMGNAVTVPTVEWILWRIASMEA